MPSDKLDEVNDLDCPLKGVCCTTDRIQKLALDNQKAIRSSG